MRGGSSANPLGGRAGYRILIARFSVPAMLPATRTYEPFTSPYLRKPPFGVTSFPSLPIFNIRLLNSVLWWKPICPARAVEDMTVCGFHGPRVATPLFVFLPL